MDVDDHVVPSGQHYSGRNRVPNIHEFVERLDKQKKERDAAIDAELKNNKQNGEAKDHVPEAKRSKKHTRTVRDPVTGKDVEIEDANIDFKEVVENPMVWRTPRLPLVCLPFT
jgi:hypothetical protein